VDLAGVEVPQGGWPQPDNITVASALFDHNGKLVTGLVKHLDLRLRPTTPSITGWRRASRSAWHWKAKPGFVPGRLVVRELEGQMMSAINLTVDIP